MTLGDILTQIEAISADVLYTTVDRLPPDEQLHRFFAESIVAMEATLEWFDVPRQNDKFLEAGEIRAMFWGFYHLVRAFQIFARPRRRSRRSYRRWF